MEEEFYREGSIDKLSQAIKGKTIESCEDESGNAWSGENFVIKFTDGSKLLINYDWIYTWELLDN